MSHPIERADADDGFPIDIDVTTARGPVDGGVVEVVRMGARAASVLSGETIGAGSVEGGHARVTVSFASGGAATVPILLRYVPAAPWYRAGPALQTDVHLSGPGVLRQILLALTVIIAGAWVVAGWRRAPKVVARDRDIIAPGPPSGRAGVQVLGPAPSATGWRGVVTDAHEGGPVAGATLLIVAPAFAGDGVVARAVSDERGAFTLEAQHRADARLVVEAPFHSTHEQALPPPSTLGVALITRRRALLDRLVRWARQKGAPFDGTPEPTPGHVRRVAARSSAAEVEAWARRVEAAAYSPEPVGEEVEHGVRDAGLALPANRSRRHGRAERSARPAPPFALRPVFAFRAPGRRHSLTYPGRSL
ncbi:MAG: carboxypeptidase-like regulatory domain-containing protein [Byssovorax sp.]